MCWDLDSAEGTSYKPKPGMLWPPRENEQSTDPHLHGGDRWRDVGSGRAAGCLRFSSTAAMQSRCGRPRTRPCADLGRPRPSFSGTPVAPETVVYGGTMTHLEAMSIKIFADGRMSAASRQCARSRGSKALRQIPLSCEKRGSRTIRHCPRRAQRCAGQTGVVRSLCRRFNEMEDQRWKSPRGEACQCKDPVTDTKRNFCGSLIRVLSMAE